MPKMLFIVASGPTDSYRAREGLVLARATQQIGMAEAVHLLLIGEGVKCLEPDGDSADLFDLLLEAISVGVEASACTRSVEEHQLLDALESLEGVRPVGAPVYLSAQADDGFAMLTF